MPRNATRAKRITSPPATLQQARELHIGRPIDRDPEKADLPSEPSAPPTQTVEVNFAGVGLSLIDQEPRELLYASLQVRASSSSSNDSAAACSRRSSSVS